MNLTVAEYCTDHTAAFRIEGQGIYAHLEQALLHKQVVELSFKGIYACSRQFLDASIGKLYSTFTQPEVESLLTITGIDPHDTILPHMIICTTDRALRPAYYEQLLTEVLATH